MKTNIRFFLTICLAMFLGCCKDDPISSNEEHLSKLWEITLNDIVATNFTLTDTSLIFKTSYNTTGKLYQVSKDGKILQSAAIGGSTRGTPVLDSSLIYTNSNTTIYALKRSDLSTIWSQSILL